jgi:hypothetical protein
MKDFQSMKIYDGKTILFNFVNFNKTMESIVMPMAKILVIACGFDELSPQLIESTFTALISHQTVLFCFAVDNDGSDFGETFASTKKILKEKLVEAGRRRPEIEFDFLADLEIVPVGFGEIHPNLVALGLSLLYSLEILLNSSFFQISSKMASMYEIGLRSSSPHGIYID